MFLLRRNVLRVPLKLDRNLKTLWQPTRTLRTKPFGVEPTIQSHTHTPVRLRKYQEECIQAVLSFLSRGEKRLGISLATGSGKTVVFTQLIDRVNPPTEDATQSLILVHRRELVEQAARHCTLAYPEKTIEIEMGNLHATGAADITVASIQSLVSKDRILKFDPTRFKLVLVDEAHHIAASSYLQVLGHFGLREKTGSPEKSGSPTALVGVSATFSRRDGLALSCAIDHIVYHKDYVAMMEDKWLSDVLFTTVQSKADLSGVKTMGKMGDFATGDLSKAVNTHEINEVTVRSWLTRAKERKSTLVFCVDINHVVSLTATFRHHGIDARFVTSDTHVRTRSETLDEFKAGNFPVLVNCGIFIEGTDIPNIDCVILARPTRSRNLLVQMIGRGMRLHPGKENCHIIDMVASLETGIVTTPTLYGLNPDEIVENASLVDLEAIRERREREKERQEQAKFALEAAAVTPSGEFKGTITFTDYDSVNDLLEDTSGERHIRGMSHFAWVQVGDEKYVLAQTSGSFLSIEKLDSGQYEITFTERHVYQRFFARPRHVGHADTFENAVHAADHFASSKFTRMLILHALPWRKKPASNAQIDALNKTRDAEHKLEYGEMSKGRAGDMLTKLKFGAKGRFKKMGQKKRILESKHERQKTLQEAMARRNAPVQVGPMRPDVEQEVYPEADPEVETWIEQWEFGPPLHYLPRP